MSFYQITDGVIKSITAPRKKKDSRLNLVPVQSDQEPLNIMFILAVLESAVLADNKSSICDGRLSVGEHADDFSDATGFKCLGLTSANAGSATPMPAIPRPTPTSTILWISAAQDSQLGVRTRSFAASYKVFSFFQFEKGRLAAGII